MKSAVAAALVGAGSLGGARVAGGRSGQGRLDDAHRPLLRLPVVSSHGDKVPVVVEMTHPMEAEHYIRSVELSNPRDPIASKGIFYFTPANGRVYLAWQVRLDEGVSEVTVTAECSVHGPCSSHGSITIHDGAGGCAGPDATRPPRSVHVRAPRIRIPALLRRRGIRPGEVFDVQVVLEHPSRTGLARQAGGFVRTGEPFYLELVEIDYSGERLSRFVTTAALSDDPLITFRLRVHHEGLLRVVATNNRQERFVGAYPISLMPPA